MSLNRLKIEFAEAKHRVRGALMILTGKAIWLDMQSAYEVGTKVKDRSAQMREFIREFAPNELIERELLERWGEVTGKSIESPGSVE